MHSISPLKFERLSGSVEHITFHNAESGFYVLRVKVKGQRDLVVVIATAASIGPGEYIECTGQWINDKKHGLQFKAEQLTVVPPTTLDGIEKYLGSGLNLAYAISIHKSQGSEFPVVVMPLSTQHYQLLARNLLYTGITRGKRLVVLIAQKQAIRMAVENNQATERLTKLAERL